MQTLQQFLQDRNGKLNSTDIQHLVSIGLNSLFPDGWFDQTEQPLPEESIQQPTEDEVELPGNTYSIFPGVQIRTLGNNLPGNIRDWLMSLAQTHVSPQSNVLVLNPWVGETLVTLAVALGDKVECKVFSIGTSADFDEEWKQSIVNQLGPQTVQAVLQQNINRNFATPIMYGQDNPAQDFDIGEQFDLIVLPPFTNRKLIDVWAPRLTAGGLMVGWGLSQPGVLTAVQSTRKELPGEMNVHGDIWQYCSTPPAPIEETVEQTIG